MFFRIVDGHSMPKVSSRSDGLQFIARERGMCPRVAVSSGFRCWAKVPVCPLRLTTVASRHPFSREPPTWLQRRPGYNRRRPRSEILAPADTVGVKGRPCSSFSTTFHR